MGMGLEHAAFALLLAAADTQDMPLVEHTSTHHCETPSVFEGESLLESDFHPVSY